MRAGWLFVLPALLLASPFAVAKDVAWPNGLYSNVQSIEETGDIVGMEARFYQDGGRRMVEFVWCEGWCNDTFSVPVTRTAGGFSFSYFQRFADGGVAAGQTMRFVAVPTGRGLAISAWQGDEKLGDTMPQRLRRVGKPFGIAVAHSGRD